MFIRPCYITNSSSTSFFGFGTVFDSSQADKLMDHIIDKIGLDLLMEKSYADPGEYETEEEQREYLKSDGLTEFMWDLHKTAPEYEDIDTTYDPWDGDVYVYVYPKLKLSESGTLELENADKALPALKTIQEWSDMVGAGKLRTVTGCWRDG
jgi:hypothetical protein